MMEELGLQMSKQSNTFQGDGLENLSTQSLGNSVSWGISKIKLEM